MRKLVIFCFAVCMTVLSVLSLFNFAQDAEESMILDKRAVILEKPETLSNREFFGTDRYCTWKDRRRHYVPLRGVGWGQATVPLL